MNVSNIVSKKLRKKIEKIVKESLKGIPWIGYLLSALLSELDDEKEKQLKEFVNTFIVYISLLEKIKIWKDVHESLARVKKDLENIFNIFKDIELERDDFNIRRKIQLLNDWSNVYKEINPLLKNSLFDKISFDEGKNELKVIHYYEELEEAECELTSIYKINDSVKEVINSNEIFKELPLLIRNFENDLNVIYNTANEIMICYIDELGKLIYRMKVELEYNYKGKGK